MKNFIQPGDMITATAPAGGIASGAGLLAGAIFGVAATSQDAGAEVEIATTGVYELNKAAAAEFAFGALVFWDPTAKQCVSSDEDTVLIGAACAPAGNGALTVRVRLNGSFS